MKSLETLNLPQLVIKLQRLEDRIDEESNKSRSAAPTDLKEKIQ